MNPRIVLLAACSAAAALALPAHAEGTATSSSANFRNDCIKPLSKVGNSGLEVGKEYTVVDQTQKDDETTLWLAPIRDGAIESFFLCRQKAAEKSPVPVKLGDLGRAGYERTGIVYGALMLPYKFQVSDKSFTNNVSVGPYVGKRSTLNGLSFTWAGTVALTQVTGNTLDAAGKPVLDADGNPQQVQLSALTLAVGLIFEIAKGANGASPFKAGVFYGQDRVSSSKSAAYPYDRKPWFAIQLGYDFTDN